MTDDLSLPLAEVFTSLQGEGPHAGRLMQFVRLGGCNLSCSWCDTPYTWDSSRFDLRVEVPRTSVAEVLERIEPGLPVVLTGGEPLIHQRSQGWWQLLEGIGYRECEIHVETNGTVAPSVGTDAWVSHYSVSPKLANAGAHKPAQSARLADGWTRAMQRGAAVLKFVVRDASEVADAVVYARLAGWPRRLVWVMPLGRTEVELRERWPAVARAAVEHGVNASHRLHVLAFGDTRGT